MALWNVQYSDEGGKLTGSITVKAKNETDAIRKVSKSFSSGAVLTAKKIK